MWKTYIESLYLKSHRNMFRTNVVNTPVTILDQFEKDEVLTFELRIHSGNQSSSENIVQMISAFKSISGLVILLSNAHFKNTVTI